MRRKSKARIFCKKILVRNPKIQGRIFGSIFSAMQNEKSQKNPKKISVGFGISLIFCYNFP